MRIIETKVFDFSELSDEAKDKAIEALSDINVDYEWWDSIYDDAKTAGIEIKSFDTYRRDIEIKFIETSKNVADLIIENHGEKCDTYQTAASFIRNLEVIENGTEDEDDDYPEKEIEELKKDFLHAIGEDYLSMLSKDYDYFTSRESIVETIEANEYQFTEDGKLF